MSERVVARDCDGREISVGAVIEPTDAPGRYTVERVDEHFVYVSGNRYARHCFVRVLVPTPQADEGEVRGWKKTSSNWPCEYRALDECIYYIQLGDSTNAAWAACRKHVETYEAFSNRGRPLTLREVVDILAPTKDVPGPAAQRHVSAAERSAAVREATQPAAVGAVCASCKAPCSELSSAGNCEYCRLRLSSLRRYSYETTRELRRVTKPDPHAISAIAAASADPYEDGDCYELPNAEWP